jgi:hypothetical protein
MPITDRLIITLAGLATSMLAVAIERYLLPNAFTYSAFFIIPAGACGMGLVAASGFYFAGRWRHCSPKGIDLALMVVISVLTMLLVYYLRYLTQVFNDGVQIADTVSFWRYLDVVWTKANYQLGRRGVLDTGELGWMGYLVALSQFSGFALSGLVVYVWLKDETTCYACGKFYQPVAAKDISIVNAEKGQRYFVTMRQFVPGDEDYALFVKAGGEASPPGQGSVQLQVALAACPGCGSELVTENMRLHNGKDWVTVPSEVRKMFVPQGQSLKPAFQ